MRNNVVLKNRPKVTVTAEEVLKETALLYLSEAILKEDYEQCPELIARAKEFGVKPAEISELIAATLKPNRRAK